jgi:hypothetical protein
VRRPVEPREKGIASYAAHFRPCMPSRRAYSAAIGSRERDFSEASGGDHLDKKRPQETVRRPAVLSIRCPHDEQPDRPRVSCSRCAVEYIALALRLLLPAYSANALLQVAR